MTSLQLSRLDPNELQSRGVTPFIVTHLRALLLYLMEETIFVQFNMFEMFANTFGFAGLECQCCLCCVTFSICKSGGV